MEHNSNHFAMSNAANQINMLHTLNLHNAVSQVYLNKAKKR